MEKPFYMAIPVYSFALERLGGKLGEGISTDAIIESSYSLPSELLNLITLRLTFQ